MTSNLVGLSENVLYKFSEAGVLGNAWCVVFLIYCAPAKFEHLFLNITNAELNLMRFCITD